MPRYRVIRHHEIEVEAPDEEAARHRGVGMVPYRVDVEPLDRAALIAYRKRLVDKREHLLAEARELHYAIQTIERELG